MLRSSRKIKSSGCRHNDAVIELLFVLPLPANEAGMKFAEAYVKQHRFQKIVKMTALALNENYTQFKVWAESSQVLKVPHEQKKNLPSRENSEYEQIIARATAQVAKPGQKKVSHAESAPLPIALVPEILEQPKKVIPKEQRRFRQRRHRRRRSHQQHHSQPRQEQTNSLENKETPLAVVKPAEPPEN